MDALLSFSKNKTLESNCIRCSNNEFTHLGVNEMELGRKKKWWKPNTVTITYINNNVFACTNCGYIEEHAIKKSK